MANRLAEFGNSPGGSCRGLRAATETTLARRVLARMAVILMGVTIAGCGAINLGKWKGIETAGKDEEYYLLKTVSLTSGASHSPKEAFDHTMHDSVNLFFVPRNEPNTYTAESIWYDPSGIEYRTIRQTYDRQRESKKGDEREATGTTRVQSIPVADLYKHKKGLWSVALYLDGKLARRLSFSVR
jgi:hypothetical protein